MARDEHLLIPRLYFIPSYPPIHLFKQPIKAKTVIRPLCTNMLWNLSDHFSPWHSSSTLGSAHLA